MFRSNSICLNLLRLRGIKSLLAYKIVAFKKTAFFHSFPFISFANRYHRTSIFRSLLSSLNTSIELRLISITP